MSACSCGLLFLVCCFRKRTSPRCTTRTDKPNSYRRCWAGWQDGYQLYYNAELAISYPVIMICAALAGLPSANWSQVGFLQENMRWFCSLHLFNCTKQAKKKKDAQGIVNCQVCCIFPVRSNPMQKLPAHKNSQCLREHSIIIRLQWLGVNVTKQLWLL